ncbi:alpha/beta fold hydrolase [Macrococcus brunensis]|uniref:alpha/beta fold hydrolase n=1 Tax=Macrococcus brunensis TaxID=198483 RepID=UPI001EF0566F|nr:alpha/beta hydrolase [Macrococcus brunensis]ULG74495.1 alpha/beta hydrolase [Macrococcus brunensis]
MKLLRFLVKIVLVLFSLLVVLLIVSSIYHYSQTSEDKTELLKYLGEHHHFVQTSDGTYSVYEKGKGHDVILFREGLLTVSNILDFMPLADELSKNHRVIMIDPLGYGMSSSPKTKRTNENINHEYHTIVSKLTDDQDQLTFINHSISGAYTMDYVNRYAGHVKRVINIDGSRPVQGLKVTDKHPFELISLAPVLNETGIIRLGFQFETTRQLTGFNEILRDMTPLYDKTLQKEYRKMNQWAFLTGDMMKYYTESNNNIARIKGMKYPADIAVLSFAASDTTKKYSDWLHLQNEVFSNTAVQHTLKIEGPHYLHHTSQTLEEDIIKFTHY